MSRSSVTTHILQFGPLSRSDGLKKVIVAAVARNGVIGADGAMPWHLPDDLARFKRITDGHALIMGRRTFESIGRPLPGRLSIVLTRDRDWGRDHDVTLARSLPEALKIAEQHGVDAYIVGGAAVYEAGMQVADTMEITEVDLTPEGDTYFPPIDRSTWREVRREPADGHQFVTYQRRTGGPELVS